MICFPQRLIVKQFQLCQRPNDVYVFAWRQNWFTDSESEVQMRADLRPELCGGNPPNQNSSCTPRNQLLIKMLKGAALQVLIFRDTFKQLKCQRQCLSALCGTSLCFPLWWAASVCAEPWHRGHSFSETFALMMRRHFFSKLSFGSHQTNVERRIMMRMGNLEHLPDVRHCLS